MDVLHAAIAIGLAILLIIRFKVDPVISLVISSVYLGLAGGVGLEGTVTEITGGFGEIMAEVGLLIGFGVLIGSLLQATGTFRRLVDIIAARVGGRLPYAMAAALSTIFPAGLAVTVPAEALTGRLDAASAGAALGMAILLLVASRLVWNRAVQRYEGASS